MCVWGGGGRGMWGASGVFGIRWGLWGMCVGGLLEELMVRSMLFWGGLLEELMVRSML